MCPPIDDGLVVSSFIAFRDETGASADSVLTNPELRTRFLDLVRRAAGDVDEEPVLRCLINARKQSKIPRR